MNPYLLLAVVAAYFLLLLLIAWISSRGAGNEGFFVGKKSSPWYLVAYGMIGTSLSGVTFMSVPGWVADKHFSYMQVVFGYFIGYLVVAFILLPIYYRLNLTSIYTYLQQRFGNTAYKTGAAFFILSRTLGATVRIYLVLNVLQIFMLDNWHVPFALTVAVILFMILLYTYQGGVKTIIFTDTLQTTFMLLALVATVWSIKSAFHMDFSALWKASADKGYTQIFDADWRSKSFLLKQILSGMFITISMTGLDQEMMQKNISCRSLKDAQKNMMSMASVMIFVVALFLFLGAMLYMYATSSSAMLYMYPTSFHLPATVKGDNIFPTIALNYLSPAIAIVFVIGLISALFPSADGAITALTSSFCIDILNFQQLTHWSEEKKVRVRKMVHLSMAGLFFVCILIFKLINSKSTLDILLDIAGYTYGPLLGLFSFGIFTKRAAQSFLVPVACVLSPIFCFVLKTYSMQWFGGYQVGFELLLINAILTFLLLLLISFIFPKTKQTAL